MRLETLTHNLPIDLPPDAAGRTIIGLSDDTRTLRPGALFILRGPAHLLPKAIAADPAAILLPAELPGASADDAQALGTIPDHITILRAAPGTPVDQRLAGQLAERFYDNPSAKLKLIGVTGTNGKTTTVTITKHLLESAGHKTGLIGTVELDTGSPQGPTPAKLTTPGAIQLSQLLAEMVANGCTHCVMEVSSHALHQGRTDHVRFAAAAFTNLTQDHLDYHGTMEAYADAKAILFEGLDADAVAVLNIQDRAKSRMKRGCKAKLLYTDFFKLGEGTSPGDPGDIICTVGHTEMTAAYSKAEFGGPWEWFAATVPMPGPHNLSNALQAAALAHATANLSAEQLRQGLETCQPVPGRLEPVGPDWPKPQTSSPKPQAPTVLVDYAHTPDALINVGSALSELTEGRLITLFGCGGDRDRAKRPLMAQAAQQHADIVILTSDNPRTEDPKQILDDAEAGFAPATRHPTPETHTIPDRAEAIRFAIGLALPGDTVLIAGKGHEDYQIIGTEKHHFDDREHAAAALRERLNPPQ